MKWPAKYEVIQRYLNTQIELPKIELKWMTTYKSEMD